MVWQLAKTQSKYRSACAKRPLTFSLVWAKRPFYAGSMCRNITELRGLEPPATSQEIEAAARQYLRKISGIARPNEKVSEAMETAVHEVAQITQRLLSDLPPRRQPPSTLPPLRRDEVRRRLGIDQ